MKKVHYFAAWSDGYCLEGCDHEHQTVASAVACINTCGGYVVAVETDLRALTDAEEAEFQSAMYGTGADSQKVKAPNRPLGWLPTR